MLTKHASRELIWVDGVSPTPADVRELMLEYHLDPALAEELLLPNFRPKIERRGATIFGVLHFPLLNNALHKHEQEIDFIMGKQFLITLRYAELDPLHSLAQALQPAVVFENPSALHGGHLFVSLAHPLYAALSHECDALEHQLHDIEERIFAGEEHHMVARLSYTSRLVHDFRQSLRAHSEALAALESFGSRFFGPEFSFYIRDLSLAHERVMRRLEALRESLIDLRETNNSLLTTKQNEIMKTLTMMAFVTFPLTLIAALFGMDTKYTPLVGLPGDFYIVLGVMIAFLIAFLIYFKHKRWL